MAATAGSVKRGPKAIAGGLVALLCALAALTLFPTQAQAQALPTSLQAGSAAFLTDSIQPQAEGAVRMQRLYNVTSGEHFYTGDLSERDYLISLGWIYEGVGWTAPAVSSQPVYRLYNPYAGDHHYTLSASERDYLVAVGWNDEGVGWYSDEGGTCAVYRQYNPYARSGAHNFTCSYDEHCRLVSLGWHDEGVAWYSLAGASTDPAPAMGVNAWGLILSAIPGRGWVSGLGDIDSAAASEVYSYLNRGASVAFVAMNTKTGKYLAYNADDMYFGASTIKAPYVASVCMNDAPGIAGWRNELRSIILDSNNYAYEQLFNRYGSWYAYNIGNRLNAGLSMDQRNYATMSPRTLAKLWAVIADYTTRGGANLDLFNDAFGYGSYHKDGWMPSTSWTGCLYHSGGFEGDVVYAVMTRWNGYTATGVDNLRGIRQALVNALR